MKAVPAPSLVFSLPYMPTWRGISCPGLEVATCWSTSHTCQYNGYDHWGHQVAMKMGMVKKKGRRRWEKKERHNIGGGGEIEELGSAIPRDGGEMHGRG